MKKSAFVTLLLGVLGGLLFSLGMCMCLLPEWNLFKPGVFVTAAGALVLIALAVSCWFAAGKPMARSNWAKLGKTAYCVISALVLGVGMAMIMTWSMMLPGILVGVVGIVMLLCIIPLFKGLH